MRCMPYLSSYSEMQAYNSTSTEVSGISATGNQMKSNKMLLDAFRRIQETVASVLDEAEDKSLVRRQAGRGNSPEWLS